MAGRLGTSAQYSSTAAESGPVPMRFAAATISSLFMPTSGRRIGSRVASLIVARFTSVCDDTCPTASPVTIACAARSSRHRLGGAQHQALQDHLPVARLGVRLEVARDGGEVHDVQARPRRRRTSAAASTSITRSAPSRCVAPPRFANT